jgi:hypothetical protein
MSELIYQVDGHKMDAYLKKRSVSVLKACSFVVAFISIIITVYLYKINAIRGASSFLFSIPLVIYATILGVRKWNQKLRNYSNTEFLLTANGISQRALGKVERDFKFSDIAVINKMKFGTTIVRGNWTTWFHYYGPRSVPYRLGNPDVIFIPSITSNYSELITTIKRARQSCASEYN